MGRDVKDAIKRNLNDSITDNDDLVEELIKTAEEKMVDDIKEEDNKVIDDDKKEDYLRVIKDKFKLVLGGIKKLDKKYLFIILVFLLLMVIVLKGVNNEKEYNYEYNYVEEIVLKYKVKIHIDFTENIIFSKYNVKLAGGNKTKTLIHGQDTDIELILEEGKYTLTFTSEEDSEIYKKVKINVSSNMEVGYKISCHWDKISVTKLYVDKDEELISNEVKLDYDKSRYVYKNYVKVIEEIEKIGFVNIIEKPLYDVKSSSLYKDGEVSSITINGSDEFKRGDVLKNDSEVIITYHLKQYDDPTRIKPPYNNSNVEGKNYADVVKAFENAGFTNIKTEEKYETSFWGNKTGEVAVIRVNDSNILTETSYDKDDEIKIIYYVITETGASDKELTQSYAKTAFERYGKSLYRYGFKCHWIIGLINAEQYDDGSWFFKVEVTIENEYGNKYKTIAEGKVSGSNNSPIVTQFYVKN